MSSPWERMSARRVWGHTDIKEVTADGRGHTWRRVEWPVKDRIVATVTQAWAKWTWELCWDEGSQSHLSRGDCTTEAGARRAVELRVKKIIAARKTDSYAWTGTERQAQNLPREKP